MCDDRERYEPVVCGGVTRMVMREGAVSKVHRHSRLARAIIAMFVFAIGAVAGAGAAALLMPT